MPEQRFNQDRQKLVECLNGLPQDEAIHAICLLALGAVQLIRTDYRHWHTVEKVIFNATVLFFCKDALANEELAEVVNYGIQVEDLRGFTDDPVRFARMLDDIESRAMKLLSAVDDQDP